MAKYSDLFSGGAGGGATPLLAETARLSGSTMTFNGTNPTDPSSTIFDIVLPTIGDIASGARYIFVDNVDAVNGTVVIDGWFVRQSHGYRPSMTMGRFKRE